MTEISLKCSCGNVQGIASGVRVNSGVRVVCCCDDCQSFAQYLEREDITDEYGGTDIFQMAPAQIKITKGAEEIRCVRLTTKGLFRWYTDCCKTPIGNTLSANIPFVGLIHNFMDDRGIRDKNLGSALGYVHTRFVKKTLPSDLKQSVSPVGIIMKSISKVILWKLKGLNKPSPFFDTDGNPISEPRILNFKR